jgi:hypothetical protein
MAATSPRKELQQSMFAEFTPQLADRYVERFGRGFDSIDFGRYSKVKNPQSATTSVLRNCWRLSLSLRHGAAR